MRMPFSSSKAAAVSSIEVPISLSADDMTRQWAYFGTPRTDEERAKSLHRVDFNTAPVEVKQTIINGRECPNWKELKLDEASFELVSDFDVTSKFSNEDFYKMQSGELDFEAYHKSVEEYVQKKLGCNMVICMHSQVRNQDKTEGGVQPYAGHGPHTDSSAVSGDQAALQMLEEKGKDPKDYRRYAYINLWKNISDESPIQNDHLAMMDERTAVKPDDYLPRDLIMNNAVGITQYGLNARHQHLHKWYYFPQMTNKEAILFKQMDSDHTISGRICFHMSVHDQDGPTTPSRESIETRMFCFWKATGDAADSTMPTEENTHKSMIKNPKQFAEDLAKGISSTSLESASVFALVLMLLAKIPLLGRLVPLSLVSSDDSSGPSTYSGKPEDYAPNFVGAIVYFPKWPGFAKSYITGMMKRAKDYDTGLLEVTKLLCADAQGHMKVKSFKASEKKEICEFLLSHEPYLVLCKEHFGDLHE